MGTVWRKNGMTLIEVLVTMAIVAAMISMLVGISKYLQTQARTKFAESTVAVIVTALSEYHDYSGKFPLECASENELETALGEMVTVSGVHNDEYWPNEAMCILLNRVPTSRKIFGAISGSLITNKDSSGGELWIEIPSGSGNKIGLVRVIDPWGKPLEYKYDPASDNFPLVRSAGPDGNFGTEDDITNK